MYLRFARLRRFAVRIARRQSGTVTTLYFDPEDWAVRFLLVGQENPVEGGSNEIASPIDLKSLDARRERLAFKVRRDAGHSLANNDLYLPLETDEIHDIVSEFGLPAFWDGSDVWGEYPTPAALRAASNGHAPAQPAPPLFPTTILMGRPVFAPDGRLGVISDLLLDVEAWRIRYFIVWLQAPGETGEVLLSPFWVSGPPEKPTVTVPMTTEAIVSGPTFRPEELEPLDEQILARYFGFLRE